MKMCDFAKMLLQAFIDNNNHAVDRLLRRSDVTTWINKTVKLSDLENHNITQKGLCYEYVRTLEALETVLAYVWTYKSVDCTGP